MPKLLNSSASWGWLSIACHWLTALGVIGLYALGWYMVELDYYDPWYKTGPDWHRSIGVLLAFLLVFRLLAKCLQIKPRALESHTEWEKISASLVHLSLYVLLLVVFISGYFISTADGRAISVFSWFEIPALIDDVDMLEDWAGDVHRWSTNVLLSLAGLHALAALKHHFWNKDETLKRMLGVVE